MADKENSPPHKRAKYMCKSSDKTAQESLQDMATLPTVLATTVPWWPGRLGVWPHCDTAMLPVIRTP